ncbi:hypothetical protein YC2023_074952 [Brassica napus]
MFLAFLVFVICFMIKKKCKKNSNKSEIVRVDEHYKMNEAIVEGPHGPEAVVLSVEDDVHIEDLVKKGEKKWEKTSSVAWLCDLSGAPTRRGVLRELKEPSIFGFCFQSEQIWVRSDLAFAGKDGEASLPPPLLSSSACTRTSSRTRFSRSCQSFSSPLWSNSGAKVHPSEDLCSLGHETRQP